MFGSLDEELTDVKKIIARWVRDIVDTKGWGTVSKGRVALGNLFATGAMHGQNDRGSAKFFEKRDITSDELPGREGPRTAAADREIVTPRQRIYEMMCVANTDGRNFPASIFYNEGWLLRLVLDWFSRQTIGHHPLNFASGAQWFSEALLPSQFLARHRGDPLAEGWTHADGIIGHVTMGSGALANATLARKAAQLLVLEAKLFSPLSSGIANAPDFDQAARSVACIAEMLYRADRRPERLPSLGFIVLAPAEQIAGRKLFNTLLSKEAIKEKVARRVSQYADTQEGEKKGLWFRDWFTPTLEQVRVAAISWDEIIRAIREEDAHFGAELWSFYDECRQFNRIQEPEIVPTVQ